jgi:hypothetical protein
MNGGAHDTLAKRPPTDLELMLYVDGELSGDRLREVRLAIEKDASLRSKVAALKLAADVVREDARTCAASVDLTDAIMGRIAADSGGTLDPRDASPAPVAEERPAPVVQPLLRPGPARPKAAANDNARGIFALAALAVAAAAGMMIWGRMAPDASRPPSAPVATLTTQAEPTNVVLEPAPTPSAERAAAPAQEGEGDVGVEVAAVDFGSRVGTIFYVPREAATSNHAATTTTVVWLADDSAGGEK